MEKINYFSEKILWSATDDPEHPFCAVYSGDELLIRLNDFPAQSLYTLIVNGEIADSFDEWSPNWRLISIANSSAYHSIAD